MRYDPKSPLESDWIPLERAAADDEAGSLNMDWLELIRVAAGFPNTTLAFLKGLTEEEQLEARNIAREQVQYFQHKSVLLIGDSVDRNTVSYLDENLGNASLMHTVPYSDITNTTCDNRAAKCDDRGIPRHVQVKALDFHVANCFTYGLVSRVW